MPQNDVEHIYMCTDSPFPVGDRTRVFMERHFPGTGEKEWGDWKWQVRNRIKSLHALEKFAALSDDERESVARGGNLPLAVTPYYLSLINPGDPAHPLRRTVIPTEAEFTASHGESSDPLGENPDMAVPGLIHKYPDRVVFLATKLCATHCRYCNRSRVVGDSEGEYSFSLSQWERSAGYIENHPEIRDCLISGGDPLLMEDERLEWLLSRLRSIDHLEIIRIGTKIPVVMPQRITGELTGMLRRYHPLWMSLHFTHPEELTPETEEACTRLADAGIPLGSQTVLLKGVNDDTETIKRLMQGLLRIRVKPYYLFHCDPVSGASHFRTSVEKGLDIIRGLRGHTSGYAVPHYAIDTTGGGKVTLLPDPVAGRDGEDLLVRNFERDIYRYPDPAGAAGKENIGE